MYLLSITVYMTKLHLALQVLRSPFPFRCQFLAVSTPGQKNNRVSRRVNSINIIQQLSFNKQDTAKGNLKHQHLFQIRALIT